MVLRGKVNFGHIFKLYSKLVSNFTLRPLVTHDVNRHEPSQSINLLYQQHMQRNLSHFIKMYNYISTELISFIL